MSSSVANRQLLSGDEAIALAALHAGVALGAGYPGTPSTEILEAFAELGGRAQWSPNEKVALEVCLGVSFAGARALATMKHVGVNVAADPLFTAAYTGVAGGLVVVSADDPGMASSQNEQDNRRYAVAAGIPMLEPSDSQEAYDLTWEAFAVSERWGLPVLLRVTTRVCHSKTIVCPRAAEAPAREPSFQRDVRGRVMIPANARPAHRRLRSKLAQIQEWNESSPLNYVVQGDKKLGTTISQPFGPKCACTTAGSSCANVASTPRCHGERPVARPIDASSHHAAVRRDHGLGCTWIARERKFVRVRARVADHRRFEPPVSGHHGVDERLAPRQKLIDCMKHARHVRTRLAHRDGTIRPDTIRRRPDTPAPSARPRQSNTAGGGDRESPTRSR